MPFVSVVIPTMRVGGIDLVLDSLAKQTFTDFEVVISDALCSYRQGAIKRAAEDRFIRCMAFEPKPNPFPVASFCAMANAGLAAATGEVILFAVDYTIFPPNALEVHAAFHRDEKHRRAGLMCPHRYVKLNVDPRFPVYGRNEIHRYARDLQLNHLNPFLLSIGSATDEPAAPFEVDAGGIAAPDGDPKLYMVEGLIQPNFFHAKNESIRREHVLSIGGWDEDYDGTHGYQDHDLADRLSKQARIMWHLEPLPIVKIASPRHVFPFAARTRDFAENEKLWQKKCASGYPAVNKNRGFSFSGEAFRSDLQRDQKMVTHLSRDEEKRLIEKSIGHPSESQTFAIITPRPLRKFRIGMIYGEFSSAIHGPFDLDGLYTRQGLTGSESSFFNLARSLAERGHEVAIFCHCTDHFDHSAGFPILPIQTLMGMTQVKDVDAVIVWNEPDYFRFVPPGVVRIVDQQLNDWGYCRVQNWQNLVDQFVFPSENSRAHHIRDEHLDKARERGTVIANSVDLDLFAGETPHRHPHRVVYCSSPDRGLHHLFVIWPLIRQQVPDAELKVFYRLEPWLARARDNDDEVGRRARFIEASIPRLANMGVEIVGPVSNSRMAKELQAAAVLAYPCDPVRYTEGFGCSVLDACAAGCLPIISDADALPSVHGPGGASVIHEKISDVYSLWVKSIVEALRHGAQEPDRSLMRIHAERHARHRVAEQWEALLSQLCVPVYRSPDLQPAKHR